MNANSLQAVLDKAAHQPEKKTATKERKPRVDKPKRAASDDKFYRPAREGQRFVGAHVEPHILRHLKMIAVEDDRTVQDEILEALDLLFVKRGKGKLADLKC